MDRAPWGLPSRRYRALHASDLGQLPLCGTCHDVEKLVANRAWADAGDAEWGFCGVGVYVGGKPVAYALVTPALYVPRRHPLAIGANADAAALLAVYVEDDQPVRAFAKQAVQRLAARLVDQRNIDAIDAAASDRGLCLRPSRGWLESTGFRPLDDGVRHRLDLHATRAWLPRPHEVVRQVAGLVIPVTPPAPAGLTEPSLREAVREPVSAAR